MAIISESNESGSHRYRSSLFLYAMTYVVVTLAALVFLNVLCVSLCKDLIYQSKEHSLVEKCQLAADELSTLSEPSGSTVADALSRMESLRAARLIVTDRAGNALYDSLGNTAGQRILLPEVLQALRGGNIFNGEYKKGVIICRSATPITVRGSIIGCVYMTEYDATLGAFVRNLQIKIFQVTGVLELFMALFSFLYAGRFSRRMDRIMNSMRIIQSGDYSHKVVIGGRDELTLLGREFNDLTDRLQTSERKRTQFVSDASHEIKTPLASIKLLSDSILQNDMDPDTLREFVADIGSEAERLNRMTAKLLSLTKIDSEVSGDIEINDMAATAEQVLRILGPTAEAAGVRTEICIDAPCPVAVLEDDLFQIIFNLAENGIKYNRPGGLLSIHLGHRDDYAELTVRDTGIGIPEEACKHIFERFYRVDKSRSRATGGSGLGLSIVHAIVQNYDGTIRVSSQPDEGSCFTVTFLLCDMEEAE